MRQYLAVNRFGLGLRPNDPPMGDVSRWLAAQWDDFDPNPPALANLPSRSQLADAVLQLRALQQEGRAERRNAADANMATSTADSGASPPADSGTPPRPAASPEQRRARRALRDIYTGAAQARVHIALDSGTPFMERWVHFWSNHFAVSVDKIACLPFAGDFEFRAIRPNVRGSFLNLLRAAVFHPAMLLFLDQAQSVGPDSPLLARYANRRRQGGRQLGLNENLAREIMELHTLGVRSGYSQGDVTAFARALTGHSVAGLARGPARRLSAGTGAGESIFIDALHQPGGQRIMGRLYAQNGAAQADAILTDLASHPATARHIAHKLAVHFVADDPPPTLVQKLADAFGTSGGDLPTLARTLIHAPESWAASPAKFKTPWDWGISAMRALGIGPNSNMRLNIGLFDQLGQTIWRPGSPAGFADVAANWAGPAALADRVDAAERLCALGPAGAAPGQMGANPNGLAARILADAIDAPTSSAIARADSAQQGMALTILSPIFLRR